MTADVSLAPRDPGSDAEGTRWLDAQEQQAWRAWLYSSQLLQDRLDRELTHATGISHAYYEILVALSETEGRMMRMSELADRCLSSRSRLSDRKSTRLNSSHANISYAVFCLKKKKQIHRSFVVHATPRR